MAKQYAVKVSEYNYKLLDSIIKAEGGTMNDAVTKLFNVFRGKPTPVMQEGLPVPPYLHVMDDNEYDRLPVDKRRDYYRMDGGRWGRLVEK